MKFYLEVLIIVMFFIINSYAQISWEQTNSPNEDWLNCISIDANDDIYVGTDGGIFLSTDNGENWTPFSLSDHDVHAIAINTKGDFFVNSGESMYRSTNSGNSWTMILHHNGGDANVAFNSIGDIFVIASGLLRSTNNGDDWEGIDSYEMIISPLAISPNDDIYAYNMACGWDMMCARYNLFCSSDSGTSWSERATPDLDDEEFADLFIHSSGEIFVVGHHDIFHSKDNGESWTEFNSEGIDSALISIAINSEGYIFAVTEGNGIYKSKTIWTSVEKMDNVLPVKYALSQNYPNPFNPSTTIEFDLPQTSDVKIEVYNTTGQKIQTLFNEKMAAGSLQVEFNAENLSSGIYYYRIEAGEFQDVKKMILLK